MTKEEEIMNFLNKKVFEPVLGSDKASKELKQGTRMTRVRMEQKDAVGMLHYFWSAVIGTDRSKKFAKQLKKAGFIRFEEVLDEFRDKFDDRWIRS